MPQFIVVLFCFTAGAASFLGCATTGKCPAAVPAQEPEAAPVQAGPLVLQGTPEIPDEFKARLQPYLNSRRAFMGDISADARRLLITTRFGETYQLHRLSTPLGAREQLSFLPEPASAPSFVPGRHDQIVFKTDIGGNEQFQLIHMDLETGAMNAFSPPNGRVAAYVWWEGGTKLAFNNNARDGKNMDIYVVDVASDETAKKLADANGHWSPLAWSHDGSKLVVLEYISIQQSLLHLIDAKSGEVTLLTPKTEPAASYTDALFSKEGDKLFVINDREGDFTRILQLDIATGKWAPLGESHDWNVEMMDMSSDGSKLIYTINEEGYSRAYLYNITTKKTTRIERIPDGIIWGIKFARDKDVFAMTLASPVTEFDVYAYNLKDQSLIRWTMSEMGGLNSSNLISPEIVRFKSFDGLSVPAFYFKPSGEGPHPVVIRIHGGPESQARPYFTAYAQYLAAEKGIAVLMPNVRGSHGYGKTYLGLDNGFKREDSVKDIGALLDWVALQPELDENKVGVTGGSYGGYMVLASLAQYSDRIAAGVDVVGISSFITFLENTKDYRRDLRRAEYGDERDPEMRGFFEKIDPINNVDKIQSPLFVAQGANDPRVPASEAEQIVAAVKESGREVWYMLAMNEGHGFAKKSNKDMFLYLMLMFFEKHLLN